MCRSCLNKYGDIQSLKCKFCVLMRQKDIGHMKCGNTVVIRGCGVSVLLNICYGITLPKHLYGPHYFTSDWLRP